MLCAIILMFLKFKFYCTESFQSREIENRNCDLASLLTSAYYLNRQSVVSKRWLYIALRKHSSFKAT
jgi:hypothetical protein